MPPSAHPILLTATKPGDSRPFQPLEFPPVCWEPAPGVRTDPGLVSAAPGGAGQGRGVLNSSEGLCQGKPSLSPPGVECGLQREFWWSNTTFPQLLVNGGVALLWGLKVLSVGMCWGIWAVQAALTPCPAHLSCTSALPISASLAWGGFEGTPREERAGLGYLSSPRGCSALLEVALWEMGAQRGGLLTLLMETMGIAAFDPLQLPNIPKC